MRCPNCKCDSCYDDGMRDFDSGLMLWRCACGWSGYRLPPAVKRAFKACRRTDRLIKKIKSHDVLCHEQHRDTPPGNGEHCHRPDCAVQKVQTALIRQRRALARAEGKEVKK